MHILITGAGPAGLATALALHAQSTRTSPIRITILELRPHPQTLGGAVNLTPLALRYLDAMGVGARLRPRGIAVPHIDVRSHRTGASLGKLWGGVDALRVLRSELVGAMVEVVREVEQLGAKQEGIEMRYGVAVKDIEEVNGEGEGGGSAIAVRFINAEGKEEVLKGVVLLGCDGIHAVVRSRFVDPDRNKTYSGRACAYGYISVPEPGSAGITTATAGEPAVDVSTLVSGRFGSLLVSFFEASRVRLYLTTVVARPEPEGGVE